MSLCDNNNNNYFVKYKITRPNLTKGQINKRTDAMMYCYSNGGDEIYIFSARFFKPSV